MKNQTHDSYSPFEFPGFSDTSVHADHQKHLHKIKRVSRIGQILLIVLAILAALSLFAKPSNKGATYKTLGPDEIRAQVKDGVVRVNWMSPGSTSKYLYVLEKSPDGALFSKVGYIYSDTTGVPMVYSMADENTMIGVNYYRLKQIHKNHQVIFSQVIRVVNVEEVTDVYHSTAVGEMHPLNAPSDKTELAEIEK